MQENRLVCCVRGTPKCYPVCPEIMEWPIYILKVFCEWRIKIQTTFQQFKYKLHQRFWSSKNSVRITDGFRIHTPYDSHLNAWLQTWKSSQNWNWVTVWVDPPFKKIFLRTIEVSSLQQKDIHVLCDERMLLIHVQL